MSIGAVAHEAWTLVIRFFLRFFAIALVVLATADLQAHADTEAAATA